MKFSTITSLVGTFVLVQAYSLNVFFENGLEVRVTGDFSTPCQEFPAQVRDVKVSKIVFDKGQYTNEFMVWDGLYCKGNVVKRGWTGTHVLGTPDYVASLRIM